MLRLSLFYRWLRLRLKLVLHIITALQFETVFLLNHAISKIKWNEVWWKNCKLLHDLQMRKVFLIIYFRRKIFGIKMESETQTCMFLHSGCQFYIHIMYLQAPGLLWWPGAWYKGNWRVRMGNVLLLSCFPLSVWKVTVYAFKWE